MIEQKNKKIIALACSPSKGRNSDYMLDFFLRGISVFDVNNKIQIEKIYLNDIYIEMYKYENSHGPTKNEKEFAELAEKIKNADGLIIATPTYNFSVPAQLKNFVDRIRFISVDLSKRDFWGQPIGLLGNISMFFLVSGGISKFAQKVLFFAFPAFWLRGVFLYFGAKVFGTYYSGDVRTFENQKILNKCESLGKKYAKNVLSEKGNGILEKIFWRPKQKD
ncbi:MAG TPA: NAD(P)H-dependent oxidoreductase [Candidatus Paceibacterota bacterium]|nr:NAD(P)H-dependent oxidoreductase [Candidatus Paceibacterota bacterium]HMP19137.1 NAD(P)H-dependent oxidoreductase [Candidatus Paceibacterota bacterium]